jgi:hypothetical protein
MHTKLGELQLSDWHLDDLRALAHEVDELCDTATLVGRNVSDRLMCEQNGIDWVAST